MSNIDSHYRGKIFKALIIYDRMIGRSTALFLLLLLSPFISSCSTTLNDPQSPGGPVLTPMELDEVGISIPVSTTTSPSPTLTPNIPTPTSSQTPTTIPKLTPTHPLMIEVMRLGDYPGSEIIFEEKLDDGANYDRFIISYQSDGNKIYALFTHPWGEKPATGWPVIILNHGYIPPDIYRTTERYIDYVDVLARNGYIVLKSDYRGHGSSEGEAGSSYSSPGYTIDVLNALASVKKYPDADPDRIGMWGHSMGGNITLRAMVVSNEIKAGAIWAGVVVSYPDMVEQWWSVRENSDFPTPDPNSQRGRWRTDWEKIYGTFEENPEFWASISANSYLEDLSGPLQLHHGTADSSVPYKLSEILYDQVSTLGLPIELFLHKDDNHNISNNFWTAMQQSVEFFNLYVKGTNLD